MSDDRLCECVDCRRAGVRRVPMAPLGQTLHGRELEDYWVAREAFEATVARLKDPSLAKAAKAVTGQGAA